MVFNIMYAFLLSMSNAILKNLQLHGNKGKGSPWDEKHLIKISKLIARAPESYGFP
jgi:hypothetical protein